MLAGELSKSPLDIQIALERYHFVLRPFINQCQKLPPGAPHLYYPQSELGVKLLDIIMGLAAHPLSKKLFSLISWLMPRSISGKKWDLPQYAAFQIDG